MSDNTMTTKTIEEKFQSCLDRIVPADRHTMELAKKRWDSVAKPIGSLGILEDDITRIAGIRRSASGITLDKSVLAVMCADHGVVAEGVTQTGKEVTRIVAENFTRGETSTSKMCRIAGTDLYPVDMGMDCEVIGVKQPDPHRIMDRKIARGSGNIVREPAMSRGDCLQALVSGIELAFTFRDMGYELLAAGEMGIGNTTPTSALLAALLDLPADTVTGRGAGLNNAGLARKVQVITQALARVQGTTDAKQLLAELGGLEIAGMVGVFLGARQYQIPVVLDGAITCVAALVAMRMEPEVVDYLLASHASEEASGRLALNALGLPAVIHGKLCLGEGSGAMMLFPLLDMAFSIYKNMGTFDDLSIEAYSRDGKPEE